MEWQWGLLAWAARLSLVRHSWALLAHHVRFLHDDHSRLSDRLGRWDGHPDRRHLGDRLDRSGVHQARRLGAPQGHQDAHPGRLGRWGAVRRHPQGDRLGHWDAWVRHRDAAHLGQRCERRLRRSDHLRGGQFRCWLVVMLYQA